MSEKKTILIIDDDSEIIDTLQTILTSNGYEILTAQDGNQGLKTAEEMQPDLVILDMMMPKRSGFLVLEQLRKKDKTKPAVIMITANEGSRHRVYAEMLGVDAYIRKPFAIDKLTDQVAKLLE
jgi:DNA-binding response OmpR family regulator